MRHFSHFRSAKSSPKIAAASNAGSFRNAAKSKASRCEGVVFAAAGRCIRITVPLVLSGKVCRTARRAARAPRRTHSPRGQGSVLALFHMRTNGSPFSVDSF
jgi:hypothetical protein